MTFVVKFDWKFVVALGTAACGIILACKVSPETAERVLTRGVDTCKELAAIAKR